ncbi:YdcF family protein [Paenibacillus campi]|uniref:YdcF family protein n=1 Tax=Paenibacillus campi TaxID=3106031 RepID=UPI002AFF30BC|nr:YdcF family protein [Paenibacillus sp. SGZ-1014]
MRVYILGAALLLLALFAFSHAADRRRLQNGVYLTSGLLLLLFAFAIYMLRSPDSFWQYASLLLLLIAVALLPVMVLAISVGLLYNGRILLKREGWKLRNTIPALAGIAIIVVPVLTLLVPPVRWVQLPVLLLELYMIYFGFLFVCYLVSSFLYNRYKPQYMTDFIIVLGSGLIRDRVPPLLASRLDGGIKLYHQQKLRGQAPVFIVSGGQGADELISEGAAMRLYLLQHHIPDHHIIVEDRSVNTMQNMRFSRSIMDDIMGARSYRCVFVTNNFHLFRAGIYARIAGIRGDGIGTHTAPYYLPGAFIREYIAVLVMHRRIHVSIMLFMLLSILILFELIPNMMYMLADNAQDSFTR